MSNTSRVEKKFIVEKHYLGKPADSVDKIITRRVELIKEVNDFCKKDASLVEVGCGNGATIFLLHDNFASCKGLDINPAHKEIFEKQKSEINATNTEFVNIDIEQESFTEKFDRLICFEVIEHFKKDESVKFLYDMLKPGGIGIISVPNKWWIFETHGARLPLLPWNRVPFFSWLPRCIHEKWSYARIYTKKRIKRILKTAGFEVVETKYIMAPMDVLKEGRFKRFVVKNFFNKNLTQCPIKSTSIFIVVTKPLQ